MSRIESMFHGVPEASEMYCRQGWRGNVEEATTCAGTPVTAFKLRGGAVSPRTTVRRAIGDDALDGEGRGGGVECARHRRARWGRSERRTVLSVGSLNGSCVVPAGGLELYRASRPSLVSDFLTLLASQLPARNIKLFPFVSSLQGFISFFPPSRPKPRVTSHTP